MRPVTTGQQTINEGVYEDVEKFLMDQSRGWQPTRTQRADKEEEVKEQFYGLNRDNYGGNPVFGRDLPPGQQPQPVNHNPEVVWRDLGKDEIMPPGAHYRMNLESGTTQVREPEPVRAETSQETKAAREEQTDAKAETRSREDTTFDQDLSARYREANADVGRSRGGMSR